MVNRPADGSGAAAGLAPHLAADILFADRWIIPPLAPPSAAIDHCGVVLHGVLTKALLALHVLGALRRAVQGDGTMARMLRG